ncbi:MATE family efflux transporter [Rickettsiales bacterium LUAb2]
MFFKSLKSILYLALPMIISNVGIIVTTVVDTVIVAKYNTLELSYRASANIIHYFILTVAAGLTQAVSIMAANYYGRKEFFKCGNVFKKAFIYGLIIGIIGFFIYWYGKHILVLLHQPNIVMHHADIILKILALGFPALVIYFMAAYFLESIKKPIAVMLVVICLNVINFVICYILVFGKLGFPALGAIGSAIATTAMSYLGAIVLVIYIFIMKEKNIFFSKCNQYKLNLKDTYNMILISLGIGVTLGIEDIAYTVNVIYSGWISATALAAYSLIMNLFMIITTVAIGVGGAAAIVAANYNGVKNIKGITAAGLAGLTINIVMVGILSILLVLFSTYIPVLYSHDPVILALIVPLLGFLALIIFVDSNQIVLANIIKGCKLVVFPSLVQLSCYLLIMISTSYYFCFYKGLGIKGLLLGIIAASSISLLLLLIGFMLISLKVLKTK